MKMLLSILDGCYSLMNKQKNQSKHHDGEYLKLLQRKSYEMRRQQEEEREAIRNALIEMKKEEHNEIKRLREVNNKKIEEIKSQHLNENRERHNRVKRMEFDTRQNIEKYWNNHMDDIMKSSNDRKNFHLKAKNQKDQILQQLEKKELELIHKLE